MIEYWRRLVRRFAKQPVGVRAVLITAVAALPTLTAVKWYRGYREVRAEERRIVARNDLAAELLPQLHSLQDLTVSVLTSLRISGGPDETTMDSLQIVAEGLWASERGIRTRLSEAYGDSVGVHYSETIQRADSLFQALTALRLADRERRTPDALSALRVEIFGRALEVGRRSIALLNTLIAAH